MTSENGKEHTTEATSVLFWKSVSPQLAFVLTQTSVPLGAVYFDFEISIILPESGRMMNPLYIKIHF